MCVWSLMIALSLYEIITQCRLSQVEFHRCEQWKKEKCVLIDALKWRLLNFQSHISITTQLCRMYFWPDKKTKNTHTQTNKLTWQQNQKFYMNLLDGNGKNHWNQHMNFMKFHEKITQSKLAAVVLAVELRLHYTLHTVIEIDAMHFLI